MDPKPQPKKIKCPTCACETFWNPSNPFRPFCSERCRLIDLGDWLEEKHVIPGTLDDSITKEPEE